MNEIGTSFLLTTFAGLSTVIGYFMIFLKGDKEKIIAFSLSFSASVMLTISILDLIPSSLSYLKEYMFFFRILLFSFFFFLGLYTSYFISHKVEQKKSNSLEKIGIISLLAIVLHNIPEGIITFMVSGVNLSLGLELAIGIGMHNIPEGVSIAIPLYYGTKNKIKTFLVVFLAGLSEVLGAFLCFLFLKNYINSFIIGIIFAFIAGMMMNISLTELLPESFQYKKRRIVFLGFLTGFIMLFMSHIL